MFLLVALGNYLGTHLLTVLLGLVATYIIGFLWHGPLFGKMWIKMNDLKPPKKGEMKFSMMLPGLSANLVLVVVQTCITALLLAMSGITTIWSAMLLMTLVWLAFTALVIVNIYAWCGKSPKLMALDALHALVALWAITAIVYMTM